MEIKGRTARYYCCLQSQNSTVGKDWTFFQAHLGSKKGNTESFDGFHGDKFEQLCQFFQTNYSVSILVEQLSTVGWNWGEVKFKGPVLAYYTGEQGKRRKAFELPLSEVGQAHANKNEVTMEFHHDDTTSVDVRHFCRFCRLIGCF